MAFESLTYYWQSWHQPHSMMYCISPGSRRFTIALQLFTWVHYKLLKGERSLSAPDECNFRIWPLREEQAAEYSACIAAAVSIVKPKGAPSRHSCSNFVQICFQNHEGECGRYASLYFNSCLTCLVCTKSDFVHNKFHCSEYTYIYFIENNNLKEQVSPDWPGRHE